MSEIQDDSQRDKNNINNETLQPTQEDETTVNDDGKEQSVTNTNEGQNSDQKECKEDKKGVEQNKRKSDVEENKKEKKKSTKNDCAPPNKKKALKGIGSCPKPPKPKKKKDKDKECPPDTNTKKRRGNKRGSSDSGTKTKKGGKGEDPVPAKRRRRSKSTKNEEEPEKSKSKLSKVGNKNGSGAPEKVESATKINTEKKSNLVYAIFIKNKKRAKYPYVFLQTNAKAYKQRLRCMRCQYQKMKVIFSVQCSPAELNLKKELRDLPYLEFQRSSFKFKAKDNILKLVRDIKRIILASYKQNETQE